MCSTASLPALSTSDLLCVWQPAPGGPDGVKGVASRLIEQHQLDDTFYIVDLANVVRLFKV